jgi:hypothetical protein
MTPLGDFLRDRLPKALPAPSAEGDKPAKSGALIAVREGIPTAEARALGAALEQYTVSEEFAEAANTAIRPPQPGESEDEFVERAKATLRNLLLDKFGRGKGVGNHYDMPLR